ncbi:MAG TPA: ferritin-like domain-containing protein, partial [Methanobacterium sp.]
MKGSKKLLLVLNALLADELTVVNQYMVHSEMCENCGYSKLRKELENRQLMKCTTQSGLLS